MSTSNQLLYVDVLVAEVIMKGASQLAPIGVRIPEDLKFKVKERARANGRSMNAEIIDTIESSFNNVDSGIYAELKSEISRMQQQLNMYQQMLAHTEQSAQQMVRHIELLEDHVRLLKEKN